MTLLSLLLQAAAESGESQGFLGGGTQMIVMMVLLFAIMYFFMIRPQQKKQKALEEARKAIKTGDKVLTAGGVHGKVKEVGDTYFVIEIADGVKIRIEKTSVFLAPEEAQQNK
ncbi:MAG: preprotein translocase subunit YajC [Dysgonomonas sp.]